MLPDYAKGSKIFQIVSFYQTVFKESIPFFIPDKRMKTRISGPELCFLDGLQTNNFLDQIDKDIYVLDLTKRFCHFSKVFSIEFLIFPVKREFDFKCDFAQMWKYKNMRLVFLNETIRDMYSKMYIIHKY